MNKIEKILILASFGGLFVRSYGSATVELVAGLTLILSFGVLHGANDLLLLQQFKSPQTLGLDRHLLMRYIAVVVLAALLFFWLPVLAIISFVLTSSYHFGEQHSERYDSHWKALDRYVFRFLYGWLLFALLFAAHQTEVNGVLATLTHSNLPEFPWKRILVGTVVLFALFVLWRIMSIPGRLQSVARDLLLLPFFALIFFSGSLIWGFAVYFILWHSIPSLLAQVQFLYGSSELGSFSKYFKSAFWYWLAAAIGITATFFFSSSVQELTSFLFAALAAITFPHAFVMLRLFKKSA
ncbi:Brp/Blh family beta-carotene 15,15'-dioxygenase [Flavobacterium aurantiibacter]|uniref:Probable beta-carotene 15,15'-dioxygenase n=1 Tax=Flavobacterium aurantiibacter TaxID=2023067 RepID=A0A255ZIB0_9FLAO|nr:Brp/Blh family beta-carotene 15,15'-dioxygenase [Flavobacterium aurantiibacter]OYQ40634.1 hypothetical protein CHX27_13205 [Flavobacterium aurantiibacter]